MPRTIMAVTVAVALVGAPGAARATALQADMGQPAQVAAGDAVSTETPAASVPAPPIVEAPAKPRKPSFLERLSTVVAAATAGMTAIRQAGAQIKAGGAGDGAAAPATVPQ